MDKMPQRRFTNQQNNTLVNVGPDETAFRCFRIWIGKDTYRMEAPEGLNGKRDLTPSQWMYQHYQRRATAAI